MDLRMGRFLSRDGIGEWGDPTELGNGYTFAGNNPWSFTDPMGGKVPKTVLKEFFQKGDQPTEAQFGSLIDSLLHHSEDRDLLGLKGYHSCGDQCMSDDSPATCGSSKMSKWFVTAAKGKDERKNLTTWIKETVDGKPWKRNLSGE